MLIAVFMWKLGNESVTDAEKSLVKNTTLLTLRTACEGFNIKFGEASSGKRVIRVEDTPYVTDAHSRVFGAAGMTYPASRVWAEALARRRHVTVLHAFFWHQALVS